MNFSPDYERAALMMQMAKRQGRIDRARRFLLPTFAFAGALALALWRIFFYV